MKACTINLCQLQWHGFSAAEPMSLSAYDKKRKFDQTPEPKGKKGSTDTQLRFVVQKHDASHLHYDFRLELKGVLKSWAVPKGPSLDPSQKRLAMAVEDHPYDYRDFEGIIPEGNYGAGTVIVWDEGYVTALGEASLDKNETEKLLWKQWQSGDLKIVLHGKKLKGAFALFKMKTQDEKAWLLVKKKDAHSGESDILTKNRSVKSGKTLERVARDHGEEVHHPEKKTTKVASRKTSPIATRTKTSARKKSSEKRSAPIKKKSGR